MSHPIFSKIPITIHQVHSTTPYTRKYAPKFINHLNIYDKKKLKYLKKLLSFAYSNSSWSLYLLKIAKRFRRFCKGTENLGQELLSSFYSIEKCELTDLFDIPLNFKLGRFTKLTLEFQAIQRSLQSPQQISKIVRNLKRTKFLKTLNIKFAQNSLEISRLFLLELQKYPHLISSFQSLGLHYECQIRHDHDLSEYLIDLKSIIQSVTHISLNIKNYQMFDMNLEDFTKLRCLNLTLGYPDEKDFAKLNSLEALENLEAFIFETPLRTIEQIESFLKHFRLPKSIKKLSLTRREALENFSLAEILLQHRNISEEWNPSKEFYERWEGFDQLSDLALTFEGTPEYSDIDFLFIAPILQRCHHLKRLAVKTTCFSCETWMEHNGNLHLVHLLQALEPSKDTLEYLKIEACKIRFQDNNAPSNFTFKKLKNFEISVRVMETRGLAYISSIVPKTIKKFHPYYNIYLHNKLEIEELFTYLEFVPKSFYRVFSISIVHVECETFEKALLQYLSSAKIEGKLAILLQEIQISDPEKLKSLIAKNINLNWTGFLRIFERSFGSLFTREKSNILYSW